MDMILVYITAASPEEARSIGRTLVEERLAACVNVIGGMTSIYRWDGAIEEATETILIAKTRKELFNELANRVKAQHSYTTPCIAEIPLGRIDGPYLDWLIAATGPA